MFPEITFEAIPFEAEVIPHLIQCIAGFTSADENSARATIEGTWKEPMTRNCFMDMLQKFDKEYAREDLLTKVQKAIKIMTQTLTVKFIDFKDLGGISSPRFNVFTHSLTKDMLTFANI